MTREGQVARNQSVANTRTADWRTLNLNFLHADFIKLKRRPELRKSLKVTLACFPKTPLVADANGGQRLGVMRQTPNKIVRIHGGECLVESKQERVGEAQLL
jgi:hypothetical protein